MKQHTKTHLFLLPLFLLISQPKTEGMLFSTDNPALAKSIAAMMEQLPQFAFLKGTIADRSEGVETVVSTFMTLDHSPGHRSFPTIQTWCERREDDRFEVVYEANRVDETLVIQKTAQSGTPLSPYAQHVARRFEENEDQITIVLPENEVMLVSNRPKYRHLRKMRARQFQKYVLDKVVHPGAGLRCNCSWCSLSLPSAHHCETENLYSVARTNDNEKLPVLMQENKKMQQPLCFDHPSIFGQLPLVGAVLANSPETVRRLQELGADPETVEPYSGLNAFQVAELEGHDNLRAVLHAEIEGEDGGE
ncbi:hypothetical protein ACFLX2_01085 [Candidatus Dependentiae bacterium]